MRRPRMLMRSLALAANSAARLDGNVKAIWPQARVLGSGVDRTAYRIGAYVVKSRAYGYTSTGHRHLRAAGVLPAQRWFVNGWEIQPFYRRPGRHQHSPTAYLDLHDGNLGRDEYGRLVAFDW